MELARAWPIRANQNVKKTCAACSIVGAATPSSAPVSTRRHCEIHMLVLISFLVTMRS